MPIGTLLIFSLFANSVRTAGLIGFGEALIDVFRPREDDGACRESISGTWHTSIAIGTILSFSLFAKNARTVGPIGMGEALIDVFRPREDDGVFYNRSVALGTLLIFLAFSRITAGLIGMGDAQIDVFRPREVDGAC